MFKLSLFKLKLVLLVVLFIVTPFVYNSNLQNLFDLPQSISLCIVLIFIVLIQLITSKNKSQLNGISLLTVLLIIYIVINITSLIWVKSRFYALEQINQRFLAFSVFFIITYIKSTYLKYIFYSLLLLSFIVSVIGILQALFNFSYIPQAMPPSATFGNRNSASQIVAVLLPLNLIILFNLYKRKRHILCVLTAIVIILNMLFVYLTKTRSSWLGLVLMVFISLIYFVLKNRTRQKSNIKKIGFTLVPIVLFLSTIFLIESRDKALNKNVLSAGSFKTRLVLWSNSIEMFKDNLVLGVGPNNFRVHYPYYHTRGKNDLAFTEGKQPVNSHNDFLQHYAEIGLLGGSLFLGIFLLTIIYIIKLTKKYRHRKNKLFFYSLLSSLIIFFTVFNFSFMYSRQIGILLFFTILGLINNYYSRKIVKKSNNKISNISYNVILILIFIGLIISGNYLIKTYQSDKLMKQLYHLSSSYNIKESIATGEKIKELNPFRKDVYITLGWAYQELGYIKKAEELFKEVLKSQPYNIYTLKKLAQIYEETDLEKYNQIIRTLYEIEPIKIELKNF